MGPIEMTGSAEERLFLVQKLTVSRHLTTIEAGRRAIEWQQNYGPFAELSVRVGDSELNLFNQCLTAITQPIIFQANLSCRLLLAFLGIGITKATPPVLCLIKNRQSTDIGIEHYRKCDGSPLEKLDPLKLLERYGDKVLSSWASVIAIVNKRLSHLTHDSSARDEDADRAMENTFTTVPELVCQEFLEKL